MADTINVIVKNTFINIIEDDELVEAEASRPRLHSDPAPHLDLRSEWIDGDAESPKFGCEKKALYSFTRTSLGDNESDIAHCGNEESSSTSSPLRTASPVQSSSCASSVCPDQEVPSQQDGLQELADQKHADGYSAATPIEWQGKTSVMVRHVSYKCTREMFRDELHKAGFDKLFDYLYLPVNMRRSTSKGYAFLNFADSASAYRFKECFDGRMMDVPGGVRPLEVIPANKQGYAENFSHYIDKRNEISAAAKPSAESLSWCQEKRHEHRHSSFSKNRNMAAEKSVDPSLPAEHETMSMCYQCQNHVPSKSHFCHFCGVGLHMSSSFACSGSYSVLMMVA
eukprot:TRINITY_DN19545_c0_g1_i4.p1 TRINITY_DN19545_c0_g1~~TRINITY_DN19545_c0_g1_i4.p1  ORF type:complete len:340 (+),score=41.12 TRINITY_DN19545_c0_g1_i4:59-1078(+)